VDLTATLFLPPNFERGKDAPLPCLLWAYPREFKSKVGSTNLSPATPLPLPLSAPPKTPPAPPALGMVAESVHGGSKSKSDCLASW